MPVTTKLSQQDCCSVMAADLGICQKTTVSIACKKDPRWCVTQPLGREVVPEVYLTSSTHRCSGRR